MPRRTVKVCAQPGCPNLTPCELHAPQPWAGSRHKERTSSGWQQQRDARKILTKYRGICHVCGHPGATDVDHVIPVAEGGPDTLANKRPIHPTPCHRDKTLAEAQRARDRSRRVG